MLTSGGKKKEFQQVLEKLVFGEEKGKANSGLIQIN